MTGQVLGAMGLCEASWVTPQLLLLMGWKGQTRQIGKRRMEEAWCLKTILETMQVHRGWPIQPLKFKIPNRKPEFLIGDLGFIFSEVELECTSKGLKFALILKFLSRRPSIDVLRRTIIKS